MGSKGTQPYIYMYPYSPPIQAATLHAAEFPVLYSRSLLVTHFKYSSVYMNMTFLIFISVVSSLHGLLTFLFALISNSPPIPLSPGFSPLPCSHIMGWLKGLEMRPGGLEMRPGFMKTAMGMDHGQSGRS